MGLGIQHEWTASANDLSCASIRMVLGVMIRPLKAFQRFFWEIIIRASGLYPSAPTLRRAIELETRNRDACESLADLFQEYDNCIAAVFCKMAAEEQQYVTVLAGIYHKRFGRMPSIIERGKFDSRTLEKALNAGLCRVLKEKTAEKRRSRWFKWFNL